MTASVNLGLFEAIPTELLPLIFAKLPFELDKIALVSTKWREATNNHALREAIRPPRAMGVQELKRVNPNIVDTGKELLLPRSVYRTYAEKGGWLVFDPGSVKMKDAYGQIEELALNTLEARGRLCQSQISAYSWKVAIKDKREEEPPHWVWIHTEVIGYDQTYGEQLETAKKEDMKAYPERYPKIATLSERADTESKPEARKLKQIVHMAKINDLALGMIMAKALFDEIPFIWDPANDKCSLIRVNDTSKDQEGEWNLLVGYTQSGIRVWCNSVSFNHSVGIVCARKSFGY